MEDLKNCILNAIDTRIEPVHMPEWGCTVYVKTLTGKELQDFQNLPQDKDHATYLLALSLCDQDGTRLFGLDEVEELQAKSWAAIAKLVIIAQKLNRFDEDSFNELVASFDNPR